MDGALPRTLRVVIGSCILTLLCVSYRTERVILSGPSHPERLKITRVARSSFFERTRYLAGLEMTWSLKKTRGGLEEWRKNLSLQAKREDGGRRGGAEALPNKNTNPNPKKCYRVGFLVNI